MWDALTDISKRENLGFNQLCTYVAATRRDGGFTSNLRVFIMSYFRDPAQAEALGGGVEGGAAGYFPVAHHPHPLPLQEGLKDRAGHRHPTHIFDLGPGHGLAASNNRQGFHHRT